jgi:NTP pyrophosphatase (non-canonical NTP hydrolase)
MNFNEYKIASSRTCPSLGSMELDLSHMVLGLGSELEELISAEVSSDTVNIGEEIGDILWYLVNYDRIRENNNFQDYKLEEHHFNFSVFIEISKLQNQVKRFVAYKKDIDRLEETKIVTNTILALKYACSKLGLDIYKIMENNIQKLKVRFPEKFTEENAINRNLEKEYDVLKK